MTLAELEQFVDSELPDNTEGLITAGKLRAVLLKFVQALREGVDE